MAFSSGLVVLAKQRLGLKLDAELLPIMPKMTKGLLSSVKSGGRTLTDEQALALATAAGYDERIALAELAAEKAANDDVKRVWLDIAKAMSG